MFTFKTDKPTGRYRSFYNPTHTIKIKKVNVGSIGHEPPYKIRLRVIKADIMEDKNPNCDWKWITLSQESNSLVEAKEFLRKNFTVIMEKYNIPTN